MDQFPARLIELDRCATIGLSFFDQSNRVKCCVLT